MPAGIRDLRPRRLAALAVLSLLSGVLTTAGAHAGAPDLPAAGSGDGWVGTWGASAMAPSALVSGVQTLNNQTVRNIVHTSVGGRELRIRLSNAFGNQAVDVGAATVARELLGAQLDADTLRAVTFHGSPSVTIPTGGSVLSDPVRMPVPAQANLAVSLYLPRPTGPATYHQDPQQTSYLSAGDHAADVAADAYSTTLATSFLVDAVQVRGPARGTLVAVGDSITDGAQGQWNANTRWPDFLFRRLAAAHGTAAPGVVNEGISGNRVLNDSVCFGTNLLSRLDRDVFSQPNVRTVVLLEGLNDLGFSQEPNSGCTAPNTEVSVAALIAAYRRIIDRAHAHGVRIYGGTLTPAQGFEYWNAAAEQKRRQVNAWILGSRAFDGVIDFASVLAYPGHPELLDPKYDSGDHLHPNDGGYQAMADAAFAALGKQIGR
ncbi:SGNH/GDSL hydrolase family protein [Virgisporangium aurantiacum]|uniref:SGNH hydrolase n=1 Tax=Virgisporangium aurantiacum TaxID=175570 RepID=A0A8J4E0M9_9ACTN|nr:SGNH/GDSL hydrolase family protein [Virgisporangium aurantiacum]GIJ56981.1 SGNH hydrolase [Virgisporangium aurantiacum]